MPTSKKRRSLSLSDDLRNDIDFIAEEKHISRQAAVEKAVQLLAGCMKLEKNRHGKLTGFEITTDEKKDEKDVLPFPWRL